MASPRSSTTPRQVVFVDEEYRQKNPKKRPAERACERCRRGKKRCTHQNGTEPSRSEARHDTNASAVSAAFPAQSTRRPTTTLQHPRNEPPVLLDANKRSGSSVASVASRPSVSRFIGDLNPERELRTPTNRTGQANENSVGIWHYDPPDPALSAGAGVPTDFAPTSLFYHCSSLTRRLLLPIMDQECLAVLPPSANLQALEAFYFENVHPIIPAIDHTTYQSSPTGSALHTLQAQTLCLAAHASINVRNHLRLPHQDSCMSPNLFARRILGAMRLNIELALTTDKAVLIRTLATMSIFAYTSDGLELSCQFFNRAVHLMMTIGLHQKRTGEQDEDVRDNLYCYIWVLDKLHAAMQGRPVVIHERDLAVTILERSINLNSAFKVFLNVANLLDRVIDLYRPKTMLDEIPSSDIPGFEVLLQSAGALNLPSHISDSLELFYNAAVILSCRSRSSPQAHGTVGPNARQSHAASQILTVLDEDVMQAVVLLPHVPYAVSLALSTAYRQIRHSQLPKTQLRARKQVHQCLRHLKGMSEAFWAAAVMAELARKALVETKSIGQGHVTDTADLLHADTIGEIGTRDKATAVSSRRQSVYGAGYVTANDDLSGFEWHSYQEPGESPLLDLGSHLWDFTGLDGLLDANLELNLPSFLPEVY